MIDNGLHLGKEVLDSMRLGVIKDEYLPGKQHAVRLFQELFVLRHRSVENDEAATLVRKDNMHYTEIFV